jgi:hypothetical protein
VVPSVAAGIDDGVIVVEDADREPVGAEILPDVLDRVELRAVGRKHEKRDVVRDDQRVSAMPAGAVEHENGMSAGRDGAGDLGEMVVHRAGIGEGHDEARGDAAVRTDRAEDVGPLVAGVARRPRACAALRPDPAERALLADARFILEPDLEWFAPGSLGDRGGYRLAEVFLNASWASGSVLGWRGRTESRR